MHNAFRRCPGPPAAWLHAAFLSLQRVLLLVWVSVYCVSMTVHADDRQRALFMQGLQAMARQDDATAQRLREQLGSYVLWPYFEGHYLLYRLRSNTTALADLDAAVQAFLDSYRLLPIGQDVYWQWLDILIDAGDLRRFARSYRADGNDRHECAMRTYWLDMHEVARALANFQTFWRKGYKIPQECQRVIEVWQATGGVTADDYWAKFQNAMDTGQVAVARAAMPYVPAAHTPEAERWMAVTLQPAVVLEQFSQWPYPDADALIRYGLRLLINQDSVGNAAGFDRLYNALGRPQSEAWMALNRQLGVYMTARRHAAGAARLLALAPAYWHDEGYEWLTRYALAQGDWAAVLARIDSMPAPLKHASVWQYWRAHCLHALGQVEAATAVFNDVAQKREYYGFLAAERLGLPHTFAHQPYAVSAEQRQRLLALVEIQRIQELRATGLQRYARDEWEGLLPQLKPAAVAAAAVLADEWQWPDRAISALARANIWHDLARRFPLTYAAPALQGATAARLHPAWVLGLMRKESLFQADVVSKARAVGLMQLLPTTATQVAQRLGLSSMPGEQLTSPDVNIRLGTAYLRALMDQFGDHPVLATAAYNAGPANVLQWLALPGRLESAIWIETVPFFETRDYLKRVLEYTVIYAWRLSGQDTLRLTDFMPVILGWQQ